MDKSNPIGGEGWVTKKEFDEYKLDVVCRIVVNLIKAGEVSSSDLRIRDRLLKLSMEELMIKLLESHELAEKQGLPLVYRWRGITK